MNRKNTKFAFCRFFCGVRSPHVRPFHRAAYRLPCTGWIPPAADDGQDCNHERDKTFLGLALPVFRAVERIHHILGLQRNRRGRHFRGPGEFIPDVCDFRTVQIQQEEVHRGSALCLPRGSLDCMGEGVFRCGHIMAMARARKRLRRLSEVRPVV